MQQPQNITNIFREEILFNCLLWFVILSILLYADSNCTLGQLSCFEKLFNVSQCVVYECFQSS